jgi:capsular exopolysaccharide synthesis family protein
MLQSNLKFLKPDQVLKTIVVTSSVSKEGKSTVSANLALTLSQMGHKVLLVDADLHHPVQHHIWQLTNVAGLSDIIVNQVELKEAIKEVEHNLSVLPAGSIPPNPLALIDSNRMRALVQNLSAKYDFVIFDTPPLILVSDVLTLSKMTSGILLVAHPHKIDGSTAKAARELLAQSEQEVLGLVINGVVAEYEPDSYPRHVKVYHKDSSPALSRI